MQWHETENGVVDTMHQALGNSMTIDYLLMDNYLRKHEAQYNTTNLPDERFPDDIKEKREHIKMEFGQSNQPAERHIKNSIFRVYYTM